MKETLIGLVIGVPIGALATWVVVVLARSAVARARSDRGVMELDTPDARDALRRPW